jgi:ABC-type thiamine transport system substrate-binding protein
MKGLTKLKVVKNSDTYKSWTEGHEVVGVSYNPKGDNVIAIAKEDEHTYHVYRFFESANGVQVSCDAQNTTADSAIEYLMDAYGEG